MKSSKPWLYAGIRAFDAAAARLGAARSARRSSVPGDAPVAERILVSNIGHLGDALLTLGVPRALRAVFPGSRVDVLLSAEGAELFRGHPDVDSVHVVEPMLLAREGGPARRLVRAARAAREARAAIAATSYDLALELRSYVPNSLPVLAAARPAVLVGFGTAGLRFLLDIEVPHIDGEHELERFARVIRAAGGPAAEHVNAAALSPALRHLGTGDDASAGGHDPAGGASSAAAVSDPPYVVLHPGTRRRKRWDAAAWPVVASRLLDIGTAVFVTGTAAERPWLEQMFRGTGARVVAGGTDLSGLIRLVAGASAFVGADSFPAHLAAAAGAGRVVVVWHPFADPAEWAPAGNGRVRVMPPSVSPAEVVAAVRERA